MKNDKQMPDEPMLEGKPASAWGWFLAGFVWLVIVFVLIVPAAFTHDPARDAAIEEMKAQVGNGNYTLIMFGVMAIALAPFMIALNRAVVISHHYRRERGMVDSKERELYERGNVWGVIAVIGAVAFVAVMIYANVAPR